MKISREEVINLTQELLNTNRFVRGIISNPVNKSEINTKINLKPLKIKDNLNMQIEKFEKNKAYHENVAVEVFLKNMEIYLENYKQIFISSVGIDYQILKNKKGYSIKENKNTNCEVSLSHNKKKRYIIDDGVPVPFLIKLGVMGDDGKVFKNSYDKFRQINKYLEFIDDTIEEMKSRKLIENTIKVVDFGCGKSYLTFALHHYLENIKKMDYQIIGLDLKEDVMDKCNQIASELGCENLEFLTGNIKDFNKLQNVDMIFSLHACNNATDYALEKGLELGAKAILAVPCCQHEFNDKMSRNKKSGFFQMDGLIGKHGILLEKYTTLATDAFRAQALELCGYKTQVMEFIDMEHTPKNILIRGIKDKVDSKKMEKKYDEYLKFMRFLGIDPLLHQLLQPYYLLKE